MARPKKENVDYFPHDCNASSKKTVGILQSTFGNDGYSAWYRLLEQLGDAPNHYLDLRAKGSLMHVASRCCVSVDVMEQALDLMAELEAIDPDLWQARVVYCEGLVKRVTDAWSKRLDRFPTKNRISELLNLSCGVFPGKTLTCLRNRGHVKNP